MQAASWVLFILGIILIILGAGLLLWGAIETEMLQPKAAPGAPVTQSWLEAIAQLFDAMGRYFGPNGAVRAGAFLMMFGLAMGILSFFVPRGRA
jgi:hypothetical protein